MVTEKVQLVKRVMELERKVVAKDCETCKGLKAENQVLRKKVDSLKLLI